MYRSLGGSQEPENRDKPALSRGEKVFILVVVVGIIGSLYPLGGPVLKKQRKAADRTEALSNIKQISAMLAEFEADYGRFPDDETALEVKRQTSTDFTLTGEYSNDYFRQILTCSWGKSEKPFWSKTAQSPRKPDDDFSTREKALADGEVGYSYIMASATRGQNSNDEPSRPVVVTPSYKFRADWTFDPEPYAGKAVVLRLDNSATPMQIRESDKKVSAGSAGKTLGDVGDGTVWGSDMNPILRAPQPRAAASK
ncbi:type II secretion system protein GspG [Haloferula sp. BvORR071]|uniref:type II secretion system protein n=1 Tax=Haloferula sp. BvORR071 TaxID=1396141 RepID=UPI000550F413|nr:type II secretion system protein GspG [Haloferula sp. BvORR071]